MSQHQQNFDSGTGQNNLQRAIQTQKMQKKNEAMHGKQSIKSGKAGCPAPLGPQPSNSIEIQKENLMAVHPQYASGYQHGALAV